MFARLFRATALCVVASAMLPVAAMADIIIVGSSVPKLKVGDVVADNAVLDIPAAARVRVILPSGRTREIAGPFKGKVRDITNGEAGDASFWNDIKRVVTSQKRADESVVGAVRSVAPASHGKNARRYVRPAPEKSGPRFSWRAVSIDADGDVCIEKAAPLTLVRGQAGRPESVTIVNRQSQKRAIAEFGVGSATAAWPRTLAVDVGLYAVVLADGTKRSLRLRPISPLPAADDTLRVLHGQRCLKQVEAWISGLITASR
ncbi:MAG: hypothetical protein KDJ37_09910 [Hyphomicrobiaceae bacterium]|nr:hypothetical protein [Hyphomicrobiaceae bacterium]